MFHLILEVNCLCSDCSGTTTNDDGKGGRAAGRHCVELCGQRHFQYSSHTIRAVTFQSSERTTQHFRDCETASSESFPGRLMQRSPHLAGGSSKYFLIVLRSYPVRLLIARILSPSRLSWLISSTSFPLSRCRPSSVFQSRG